MSQPDAAATDPRANGWMQGFPPAADKLIKLEDNSSWRFPYIRWAFSHQRELSPTANVRRGGGAAWALPYALRNDIDDISFTTMDGRTLNWAQSLDVNYTDGILVLHRGAVIYEKYLGALTPDLPHLAMSVTKSFVGLIAAMLIDEGALDPDAPVTRYVPELSASAYGDASVRQVLDMTIGVQYSEDYTDRSAEIFAYTLACGIATRPADYAGPKSIFEFLQGLKKQGEHGQAFAYKTCNTEVLAWIVQRVSATPMAHLLSERIWQKLGVEEDAHLLVDRTGAAMCGGGLNLTLRDMARFGEMMRCDGAANGRQIAPAKIVADIRNGGDREHFAKAKYSTLQGWSYRNQWWVAHDNLGSFTARGIHGQAIWVAPAAELVIARFGSHHIAGNANGPLDHVSLPAFRALADHLMRS
ncbi:serine hydrolase domain-containing protein [Vitreimonas flagellata]|uniref:serine hydrolase domain-containing protein n=1 Tax=Vitreimonas flagellata TaxID=2560861 RepID=UPI0010752B93|nr:serine hydrolase [Vitreimonas flagellata]